MHTGTHTHARTHVCVHTRPLCRMGGGGRSRRFCSVSLQQPEIFSTDRCVLIGYRLIPASAGSRGVGGGWGAVEVGVATPGRSSRQSVLTNTTNTAQCTHSVQAVQTCLLFWFSRNHCYSQACGSPLSREIAVIVRYRKPPNILSKLFYLGIFHTMVFEVVKYAYRYLFSIFLYFSLEICLCTYFLHKGYM